MGAKIELKIIIRVRKGRSLKVKVSCIMGFEVRRLRLASHGVKGETRERKSRRADMKVTCYGIFYFKVREERAMATAVTIAGSWMLNRLLGMIQECDAIWRAM